MDNLNIHDYGQADPPEDATDKIDTAQLRELYEVEGFMAPYVVVRRRSDGKRGVMEFTHSPRYYFDFREA